MATLGEPDVPTSAFTVRAAGMIALVVVGFIVEMRSLDHGGTMSARRRAPKGDRLDALIPFHGNE